MAFQEILSVSWKAIRESVLLMRVISDLSVVDVFNLAIVLYLWFYQVFAKCKLTI